MEISTSPQGKVPPPENPPHHPAGTDSPAARFFERLVRLAAEACGKPTAWICVIDPRQRRSTASAGWDGGNELLRDAALFAHTTTHGDWFEAPDARLDPRLASHPLVTGAPAIRHWAGAPVILPGGVCVGMLCIIDRVAGHLDDAQVRCLRSLAGLAADALAMQQNLVDRPLEDDADAGAIHGHKARFGGHAESPVKTLEELLLERDEMTQVLAHEVRQPLNNASAALQSASALLLEKGEKAASLRLARAQTVMSQVLASIDNTLAVASLLARKGQAEGADTDIDTLVAVVLGDLPASERHRISVCRVATSRTVFADMSLLRLALRNLLLNALNYSPPHAAVVVRLIDSDHPLALFIDVEDAGSGIETALVPRLFERGARGSRSGGPPGHGLGLYIVRRVMELHGGRVELVRSTAQGSTLRLVVTSPSDTRMGELGPA